MAMNKVYNVIIKCNGLTIFRGEMVGYKILEVSKGYTVIIQRK